MVTHTQNLCSAFNPFNVHTHTAVNTHTHTVNTHTHTVNTHTHSSEHTHTHTVNTHTTVNKHPAHPRTVGGSVPCSRVSPQSWYWGGRERWLFTTKSKWLDNWDCLGFWGIKEGVHFYHCRVVVSTHCKDTFICKWRYFASNISFKIKILSS